MFLKITLKPSVEKGKFFFLIILLNFSIFFLFPFDLLAKMYKWVDETGQVHWSDKPPHPGANIDALKEYETVEDRMKTRGLYDRPREKKSRHKKSRKSIFPTDYYETPAELPPSIYDDFLISVTIVRTTGSVGTGFFISNDGLVVTNYHVVRAARKVVIETRDRKKIDGVVVTFDKKRDLALIRTNFANDNFLCLATPNDGGVGSDVVAIGTPKGFLDWSVSKGIVSSIRKLNGIAVIQTDAALNSGNSGGPLISIKTGKVIGINTFKFVGSTTEGLNFAVSAQELKRAFPDIVQ